MDFQGQWLFPSPKKKSCDIFTELTGKHLRARAFFLLFIQQ